jgi:hypothetical protein
MEGEASMSTRIDGEEVESSFEAWSVRRISSDGEMVEIVFDDGEIAARLDHKMFGGELWVRTGYMTKGHAVEDDEAELTAIP